MQNKLNAKAQARAIFDAALQASLPKNFMPSSVGLRGEILSIEEQSYDLSSYKNIYLFGSGKAAFTMAQEMESLLGERIRGGVVVVPERAESLCFVEVCEGSHPLPTQKSLCAAQRLVDAMESLEHDDFFIYLLSGGSSALIELPRLGLSLEDMQNATELMLANGLSIEQINTVRKHLSCIKGGGVASRVNAKGVVLVLSDVVGDDLYSIGSAPLYADTTTFNDAKTILEEKHIFALMPQNVQRVLEDGIAKKIPETPKLPKEDIVHIVLASNRLALLAAQKRANTEGLTSHIIEKPIEGDVEDVVAWMLDEYVKSEAECLLFGGEATVSVRGEGKGGRNQHMAALILEQICKRGLDMTFLSAGTDGIDGNSAAAGAVVSKSDCASLDLKELEKYRENFDTHTFLKKLDALVVTGASGTNVIDIAIIIKGE